MGGASEFLATATLELRQMMGRFSIIFANKTSVYLQLASFMTPQMRQANVPCLATAIAWFYGPELPEIQGRSRMPKNIEN